MNDIVAKFPRGSSPNLDQEHCHVLRDRDSTRSMNVLYAFLNSKSRPYWQEPTGLASIYRTCTQRFASLPYIVWWRVRSKRAISNLRPHPATYYGLGGFQVATKHLLPATRGSPALYLHPSSATLVRTISTGLLPQHWLPIMTDSTTRTTYVVCIIILLQLFLPRLTCPQTKMVFKYVGFRISLEQAAKITRDVSGRDFTNVEKENLETAMLAGLSHALSIDPPGRMLWATRWPRLAPRSKDSEPRILLCQHAYSHPHESMENYAKVSPTKIDQKVRAWLIKHGMDTLEVDNQWVTVGTPQWS